eukprot:5598239-Pleurochrysis_carterae.AAC.3
MRAHEHTHRPTCPLARTNRRSDDRTHARTRWASSSLVGGAFQASARRTQHRVHLLLPRRASAQDRRIRRARLLWRPLELAGLCHRRLQPHRALPVREQPQRLARPAHAACAASAATPLQIPRDAAGGRGALPDDAGHPQRDHRPVRAVGREWHLGGAALLRPSLVVRAVRAASADSTELRCLARAARSVRACEQDRVRGDGGRAGGGVRGWRAQRHAVRAAERRARRLVPGRVDAADLRLQQHRRGLVDAFCHRDAAGVGADQPRGPGLARRRSGAAVRIEHRRGSVLHRVHCPRRLHPYQALCGCCDRQLQSTEGREVRISIHG